MCCSVGLAGGGQGRGRCRTAGYPLSSSFLSVTEPSARESKFGSRGGIPYCFTILYSF